MPKLAVIVLALAASVAVAVEFSAVLTTRTLNDRPLIVPSDLPSRPTVLIVGFTRASRVQTAAWSRRLAQDSTIQAVAVIYQVAILEDVPSLLRGFVTRGIRADVPDTLRDRFLVVTEESETWKALSLYTDPDAAYLLLIDKDHQVTWRSHGEANDESVSALQRQIVILGEHS